MACLPFDTTPNPESNFGNGQPWAALMPLNVLIDFFYDTHRFKIYLGTGGPAAGMGLSSRQMQVPPQILNQLDIANKAANALDATQTDKDTYTKLQTKARTQSAPGSGSFLKALDINTKGMYPIHSWIPGMTGGGQLVGCWIDFGSIKMLGQGMKFPNPRSAIPTYNRYTSGLYAPAINVIAGDVGTDLGANIVGQLALQQYDDPNNGGFQIFLYGPGDDGDFAQGKAWPRERFSDLVLNPRSGQGGTTVQIAVPDDDDEDDPRLMTCFSGFKNVKKVSFDGFDVTDSFSFQTENLGIDPELGKQVVNESCSVEVPEGARSGYFTFYSEGPESDQSSNVICDQFTVPMKFEVTS